MRLFRGSLGKSDGFSTSRERWVAAVKVVKVELERDQDLLRALGNDGEIGIDKSLGKMWCGFWLPPGDSSDFFALISAQVCLS